ALALCEFEVVRYQPPQTLICPKEDALYLGLHLLRKIWIVFPVRWLRLGGENELTAVKAIAAVKKRLQIAVGKGQQPGGHPSLIALLAFTLQIHLALGGNDGFYIVGLPQGLHSHIVIHTQENVFQIRTGKPVFGYFPDAAVLHVGTAQSSQHSADLRLSFAAA